LNARRPAAFLDRDGTLMNDSGFIGDPSRIEVLDGVAEALRALEEAGYLRIVVTNQSGVARGYFDRPDVERVHERLTELLAARGASIDAYYYCAHLDDDCDCRKPGTGMVRRASEEHAIDLDRSVVFGDRDSDMGLARNLGIAGVLVNEMPGYRGVEPLVRAPSLLAGVRWYLETVHA
jgi:D-glycero-D-manno-heptose 1,7-bisphosphate phosphatase